MAPHFLEHLVEGEPGFRPEPWYNPHGDCIIFKSENVAVIAERVDDILTLYYSAEDDTRPVGFQIKGVKHLMDKLRCNAVSVTGEASPAHLSVSLSFLLMTAYDERPKTIRRRERYAKAQEALHPAPEPAISLEDVVSV